MKGGTGQGEESRRYGRKAKIEETRTRTEIKKEGKKTHWAAAGAIKYNPKQLTKIWVPLECEKQEVTKVHILPAWILTSLIKKFRTMNW
jgi:hypothetical protein